jgi:hypothetical protein
MLDKTLYHNILDFIKVSKWKSLESIKATRAGVLKRSHKFLEFRNILQYKIMVKCANWRT